MVTTISRGKTKICRDLSLGIQIVQEQGTKKNLDLHLCLFDMESYQGYILGLLLFLCYIKELPGVVWGDSNSVYLYADDTNVVFFQPNAREY